jgi:hypothetical protein
MCWNSLEGGLPLWELEESAFVVMDIYSKLVGASNLLRLLKPGYYIVPREN